MLKLLALQSPACAARHRAWANDLSAIASLAGFEFDLEGEVPAQIDGLILLCASASDEQFFAEHLLKSPEHAKNKAAVVIALDDYPQHGSLALLNSAHAFVYPHGLKVTSHQPSVAVSDWLAGFSKFAAAVKMWRSLEGTTIACAREAGLAPQVSHINILTRDLGVSQAFYEQVLSARYCYNLGPRKIVMELNGFDFFIELNPTFSYPPGYHIGLRALPHDVQRIADKVATWPGINVVKGNGPAPGFHHGPDNVRTAVYFEDPDGLVIEVYSSEIEMIETNPRLVLDHL